MRSNIEPLAREMFGRLAPALGNDADALTDRFWWIMAAYIEAGLVYESNGMFFAMKASEAEFDAAVEAYRTTHA